MIFGKFWQDKLNTGIYEIDGHYYTPKWYANLTITDIMECKAIIEEAYSAKPEKVPKSIMLAGIKQWQRVMAAGFGTWYALTCFHIYDSTVNAGTCPAWAKVMEQSNTFIIHEYQPGKVVYLGKPELIYMYFVDSPAPVITPPIPPVTPPTSKIPWWVFVVIGVLVVVLAVVVLIK